jgi:exosortase
VLEFIAVADGVLLGMMLIYYNPQGKSVRLLFAGLVSVLLWMAAFVLCYGMKSFYAALYPLCCLFLMIPLPPARMDWVAAILQHGSAAVSYDLLRLSGIPVLRRGIDFSLPGLDFVVATECSGVRSGLALMMVAVMLATYICDLDGPGWC